MNIHHLTLNFQFLLLNSHLSLKLKKMAKRISVVSSSNQPKKLKLSDDTEMFSVDDLQLGTFEIGENIFLNLVYDQVFEDFYITLFREHDDGETRKLYLVLNQWKAYETSYPR